MRLLFRADNLAGDLVRSLHSGGGDFRTLTDLHAKFLITDTAAMNASWPSATDRSRAHAALWGTPRGALHSH